MLPVDVDEEGMKLGELERVCVENTDAKVIYMIETGQNPSGSFNMFFISLLPGK